MTLDKRIAYYVGQGMTLMEARRKAEEDIRQRLSEIRDNNNNIRTAEGERQEAIRNAGSAFGNIEAITDNVEGIIVDERTSLESDLARVHEMISNAEQGYLRDQYLNERNKQVHTSTSERLKQLQERETEVRQRLSEIRDHNNNIRTAEGERQEAIRNAGSAFGNIEAITDNVEGIIVDERTELQNELTQILTNQSVLIEQLRQEKIEQDKKDEQNSIQQDLEEVTPSAFAMHLYADGNNPMFETLEDAMAYAAEHPELEEEWTKNNEVQDNIKDEFDPSHALPPGDEIPPASAQMGESKPANEKLTTRFKEWFKKIWKKVIVATVGEETATKAKNFGDRMQQEYLENNGLEETFKCQTYAGYRNGTLAPQNDDFATTVSHPTLANTKLMIVADGVGGCRYGNIASQQFCKYMETWFERLETDDISPESLREAIMAADQLMKKENYGKYDETPSTVASTILITPTETLVSTVGDTRVYLETENGLEPIVRAESRYDKAMELGETYDIYDDISYEKRMPSGYIGYGDNSWDLCCPEVEVISNDSYKGILAVSDGVYKETSNDYLQAIFDKCDSEDLADCIVEFSAEGNLLAPEYCFAGLKFGKDNTDNITAAVYRKNSMLNKQVSSPKVKRLR